MNMQQLTIFDAFDYSVVDEFLESAPGSIVAYYFSERENAVTDYALFEDNRFKKFELVNGQWQQDERWLRIVPNWNPGYYWTLV